MLKLIAIATLFACGPSGSQSPPGEPSRPTPIADAKPPEPALACTSDRECSFADACHPACVDGQCTLRALSC
jgi:hypothetical protein